MRGERDTWKEWAPEAIPMWKGPADPEIPEDQRTVVTCGHDPDRMVVLLTDEWLVRGCLMCGKTYDKRLPRGAADRIRRARGAKT